jgi:hypothetical protein
VQAGIIDPTGRWVVTLTEDSHVLLWDAQTAELLAAFSVPYLQPRLTDAERARLTGARIPLACFSADNRFLYVLISQGLLVRISLDVDSRSSERVAAESALRSGAEFDGAGGLKILEPDELAARWRTIGRLSAPARSASSNSKRPNLATRAKAAFIATEFSRR